MRFRLIILSAILFIVAGAQGMKAQDYSAHLQSSVSTIAYVNP